MQNKFYKKNWFIWLMIIFIFPLGLFLLFKYSNYSNKTKIIITIIILGLVIFSKVLPTEESINQTPEQTVTNQEVKSEKNNEIPELICKQAGIGDTLESWIDEYNEPNKDNGMNKTFENDKLLVLFADNRALNITIQDNKNGKKDNDLINKILPTDITKISEQDESDDTIIKHKEIYHSDLIQKNISKSDGTVTIIDQFDKNTGTYLSTIIDCTPGL